MIKLNMAGAVLAISGLLMCAGTPAEAKTAHSTSSRIDTLFRVDMLNSNLEYVEHMIGPAKYTNASAAGQPIETRDYIVDGCNIEIGYRKKAVVYMGIKGVSSRCQFPLSRFVPHTPATHVDELSTLTFDMFEKQVGPGIGKNKYDIECLASCGNSADASVSLYHDGPHVDEFINIMVQEDYPYADKVSDKALLDFEDVLIKNETHDYIGYGRVKCDPKYQALERDMFKNSRVKNVFVGFDLGSLALSCKG